ncbi:valine--tRNA ligase [Novosphingobium mangrovi (ex Huang et al. 2023)]|uniref:Valine--tRNA ligase n=1 Tax=Novosphingobium mangrovi (ex Huang et al. 2023) TaxID=2976432 RepID=A0ABT2I4F5_9SPHN|nr:valine--tRNA ligase [Novosphingobium mangrovi (ex Huang et al. 2023)]MCT2399705.1 valine--tRNA ligase [Novosphingobium mangrovi (ex Huang et al. 2023)]
MTETAPETALDKTFDPAQIEAKWYARWEQDGLFRPERPDAQPFTIVNPPPNVTGSLHIGHALDNTLQDVVIRYERLRGKDALWVVGTDHAGIATQMVVERQLEARQDKRTNYTREQFVDKVWEWKHESGGTITGQLRRLGCSMDWSREQFTMDPHFTKAVVKVFVDLYNEGLIYRDKRLVNWDPRLKTAISDLEVETREVQGSFWHFRYPLSDGSGYITVATTRPETMLADMAVAVNPEDARYKALLARKATVILPITGREIPIVADEHADPELGSGAVKITPGHDFNDFEVGKRAGFKPADMLNMLDAEAHVCQTADGLIPEKYLGLDRFEAREMIVDEMKELGFLIPHVTRDKEGHEFAHDAEPRTIQTPYGDRGGVVIEPWLTDQWYVDAAKLAGPPMEAVRSGAIEIVPKTWEKTFFNWMENIQPWCVSRQLWWGHRIPAWYAEDGEVFVAETEEQAQALAGNKSLTRDEDVLDTWFSSALWPFATLGWPDNVIENPAQPELVEGPSPSAERASTLRQAQGSARAEKVKAVPGSLLDRHYPNDLLVSGFDILFFWDARMAMQGIHFMKEVPWKRLYLHGLVRAADGAKMSKSKGNVVDPLGLIDQYGADALRFFMAAMESQGRDVKMDEKRVEGYRNFATKLWNAARFCQSNGIGASTSVAAPAATSAVNKWIIGEVVECQAELDKAMADLRFDAAANTVYHFVWDQFCDWYIELVKGNFDAETKAVAGWVLDQILVMLHPFMPFVTEELWSKMGDRADYPLITAKWPEPGASVDAGAKAEVEWLIALVGNLRGAKAELGIAPGARLTAYLADPSDTTRAIVERNGAVVDRLARLDAIHFEAAPAGPMLQIGAGDAMLAIPLEGVIDIAAEKARLEKALAASQKEAKSLEGRLSNPKFVEKAKPEAVEKARADHAHHAAEAERLAAALKRLG